MTKDMTQGSPLKLILAFAVPLMLGSLFQQFYNLADTIIVGRFVGVDALAAVGSVGGLNYLVLGFVNGIACGFSIPISWTFGAKDYSEMRRYTANTVWLSLFFAVVLTVVTVALTRAVLVWTNTPDNIIDIADIYIRTIFWGIPFTLLYNVTSALMRALGDSKRPLYFLLVASVLNIGLDLLCILTFRMGAFGAAFATVFSQAVAGIGSLIYIGRHYPGAEMEQGRGTSERQPLPQALQHGHPHGPAVQHHGHWQRGAAGCGERSGQRHRGRADRRQQGRSVPQRAAGEHRHRHDHLRQPEHGRTRPEPREQGRQYRAGNWLRLQCGVLPHPACAGCAAYQPLPREQRGGDHGECPQLHLLEQRVLHPAGCPHHLPLHHPGPGLFRPCHVRGVAEMVARAMVGFWFVPLWGYFAACIANPVAWFFACFFLIPAYFAVRKRLMKELAAARMED